MITLHEIVEGQPDRPIFSVPARELVRATLTIGFLRLFLPDGRTFHLGLAAALPAPADDEDVETYVRRTSGRGVADDMWWQHELQAAGVPLKVRGGRWFTGVVIGATVAIVVAAALLVIVVGS
ncbi:hypothetical protein ASE12_05790 [Aeromicrobium sp. Root236]|uniref:hypothetical protein n=1 Tax=Aeromicrobium sp. Root236 TaxID=1736498 RepID=UPI0006FFC7FD|nr:hypothetical protein [Aeromicrobium sp. Root236]KRC64322.1 hypothetical protein ASE12_05790 [Aeromicrobium sp. Root236]